MAFIPDSRLTTDFIGTTMRSFHSSCTFYLDLESTLTVTLLLSEQTWLQSVMGETIMVEAEVY